MPKSEMTESFDAASDFAVAGNAHQAEPAAVNLDEVELVEADAPEAAAILNQQPKQPQVVAQPKAQPEGQDGEFPNDIKAAFELLTKLDNENPIEIRHVTAAADRAREIARRDRLARLRAHVFALQQPPPAPVMDANAMAAVKVAQEAQPSTIADRIAELRAKLRR